GSRARRGQARRGRRSGAARGRLTSIVVPAPTGKARGQASTAIHIRYGEIDHAEASSPRTRERQGWQVRQEGRAQPESRAVPPPQVLPLHRGEGEGSRLQGHRRPQGLHQREREDHPGAHHRHQGPLPAPARRGHQARALPRAPALHRPALRPAMQVILMEKMTNLGGLGDVVKVKDGFARNYLIPQGKAKRATQANLKEFEGRRAELEKKANEQLTGAQEKAARLEGLKVDIAQKAGVDGRLFGSVTNADIAEALTRETGVAVRKAEIR